MPRRRFLGALGVSLASLSALGIAGRDPAKGDPPSVDVAQAATHSVWIWQFSEDGDATQIASQLADKDLAVVVKTHDGVDWMSTYDHVPGAIDGPEEVGVVASFFENRAVPFHAWCVIKGSDPVREAEMAASVLGAGARSLTLDLESYEGFWFGSVDDARRFGDALRSAVPSARVDLAIDPRPWMMGRVPIDEFVQFTDGLRPQLYWDVFNTEDNANAYSYMGIPPGSDGITPEFLLDATHQLLSPYDRPVIPVGQGSAVDPTAWPRFMHRAWELEMQPVEIWRYGVTSTSVIDYLADNPPGGEPAAAG
jgi:hypothetical protein